MRDVLLYFSLVHHGDWQKIYRSIERKEPIDIERLKVMKSSLACDFITIIDDDYPESLKHCYYPPYVLYFKGKKDLLNDKNKVAIIGSRQHSEYGAIMADKLSKEFCEQDYVIISGAARGIDILAQKACLYANGKTIAIVGNGLNHYYPYENKAIIMEIEQKCLVMSEYPPDVPATKSNFPSRNRLIAALSDAIIVVEAQSKSGTLITVRHALDVGKDIYCVPFRANDNSMCNELIKQGALLIESFKDYKL